MCGWIHFVTSCTYDIIPDRLFRRTCKGTPGPGPEGSLGVLFRTGETDGAVPVRPGGVRLFARDALRAVPNRLVRGTGAHALVAGPQRLAEIYVVAGHTLRLVPDRRVGVLLVTRDAHEAVPKWRISWTRGDTPVPVPVRRAGVALPAGDALRPGPERFLVVLLVARDAPSAVFDRHVPGAHVQALVARPVRLV